MPAVVILGLVAAGGLVAFHVAASVVNRVAAFLRHFALVWRFLSGHTCNGQYHTNATWTRRADKVLHPTGRAHPWHWLPRGVRALIRTGSTVLALLMLAGLVFETVLTLVLLGLGLLAALGYAAWRAYAGIRSWRHYRTWERPLHRALTPVLGAPPARLAIERDRSGRVPPPARGVHRRRPRPRGHRRTPSRPSSALEAPDASWKLDGKAARGHVHPEPAAAVPRVVGATSSRPSSPQARTS